jgi:hypothetical protein
MIALPSLGDSYSERLLTTSSTMNTTTSTSITRLWHVVTVTSNKLRTTANQPEHDLRRLTLLCNTLDQNTSLLHSMMAASMIHSSKEAAIAIQILPTTTLSINLSIYNQSNCSKKRSQSTQSGKNTNYLTSIQSDGVKLIELIVDNSVVDNYAAVA